MNGVLSLAPGLGCTYRATLKKLVVNECESEGLELVATFTLSNSVVAELLQFVGQPVVLHLQRRTWTPPPKRASYRSAQGETFIGPDLPPVV